MRILTLQLQVHFSFEEITGSKSHFICIIECLQQSYF